MLRRQKKAFLNPLTYDYFLFFKVSLMRIQKIIVYVLCAFLIASAIVYFLVALGEYTDWMELLGYGIEDETQEKLVEIVLFVSSGIVYLGLFTWVLKAGGRKRLPYIASIAVSVALIITYIASRTVGVPIVGVEYYVGRLDVISKIIQIIVIGISGFALFNMKNQLSKGVT
jgi:magnesium-transporting ATPase (P-type)